MKNLLTMLAALTIIATPLAVVAQETGSQQALPTVSVDAKGDDVRSVLHDLFGQAKKNYVLDPGVRFALYLSLNDIEFEEALHLICKNASLAYEIQNGIYFVKRAPAPQPKPEPKLEEKPKGKLPEAVLAKPVTTKLEKTDLRALFTELGKQTEITFEVDSAVPAYKLDAFLTKLSLKSALTQICEATKLEYVLTDRLTILIRKKTEENRIVLRSGAE
jgi:type II secretory pathway component GspD/PulD (secretin)